MIENSLENENHSPNDLTVSPMSQSYNPVPFNPSMAYSDL